MQGVFENLTRGMLAGAAGTVVLNVATYLDVTVRGRPTSEVPAKTAGRLAEEAGVELGEGEQAQQRRSGLGALFGYATGLGVGGVYGIVQPRLAGMPLPLAAVAVGAAAMAASDLTATATGASDPRQWGPKGWLADILPHLAYGLATAGTFEWLQRSGWRPGRSG